MTAYDDLMIHEREMQALSQVAGRLGWDQETMMPRGAADQRSEESGAMQAVLHARRTDARRGDLLAAAEAEVTDDVARAQLRHIRRDFDRAARVPGDLAVALARLTSRAQGQWAAARAADDYPAFAPVLAEVVRLKREEAAAVAQGGDLYDALIDDFEPGMTAARLDTLFAEMRPRLVDLRARALDRDWPVLDAHFDPTRSCASRASWRAISAMISRAGGSIWRCIRSVPARATMCASPRGSAKAIRSTASIRRSTRSGMPATSRASTPPIA